METKLNISVNNEQRLFVISCGGGYSCLGFDVVYEQSRELRRRLAAAGEKENAPEKMQAAHQVAQQLPESEIGTLEQYHQYRTLLALYAQLGDIATWFDARTPVAVQKALEKARKSAHQVRLFYGDSETGRSWLDEYDMVGRISRTGGLMKSPIVVTESDGGPCILTACIVRIIDLTTNKELYRHPKFYVPKMELVEAAGTEKASGCTHSVKVQHHETGEMETHASFSSMGQAARWIAFMTGDVYFGENMKLAA